MRRVVTAYSDGSATPNPGLGGWGCCLIYESLPSSTLSIAWTKCGGKLQSTNNEMELTAVLEILKMVKRGDDVTIFADSQYVLKPIINEGIDGYVELVNGKPAFTGWLKNWLPKGLMTKSKKPRANAQLWKDVVKIITEHLLAGTTLHFQWVKGHSGDYGNELADQLADQGALKI